MLIMHIKDNKNEQEKREKENRRVLLKATMCHTFQQI
jgi:hypothetical protein